MSLGRLCRSGLKGKRGFFLVDSIIAVFVVSIALVALSFLYSQGVDSEVQATRHEKGLQLAAEWMEYLKTADGEHEVTARIKTRNLIQNLAGDAKKAEWQNLVISNNNNNYSVRVNDKTNNYHYLVAAEYSDYGDTTNGRDKLKRTKVTVSGDDAKTKTIVLTGYVKLW